jgi:flagellar biosynthetic protein FliR
MFPRELMAADLFKILLVFARIGAALMLLPGFGNVLVSARARLLLALILSLLLEPSLGGRLPPMPADPLSLFLLLAGEVTIGVFFGLVAQILVSPLDLAGSTIGYAVGLTNMFVFDPLSEQQSALLTGFLNLTAINLVFLSNAHHLMFQAMVDSYTLLVPGRPLPTDDFSATLVRTLGEAFVMGFKLSAPLMVFALTFNTALGLLSRLVPQMQVFLVGLPVQILGGLAIFSACLAPILSWFLRHFTDGMTSFLAPG